MEFNVTKHGRRRQHSRHREQLQAVAEQLKRTCNVLLEERAQLLQQHNLLSTLADTLGHYRATMQEEDHEPCMGQAAAKLEQLLLEQLSIVQVPSQPLSLCSNSTDSSAGSNGSVSDSPDELADAGSTCTSGSSWGERTFSLLLAPRCGAAGGAAAAAPPACWLSTTRRLSSLSFQSGAGSEFSRQQSFTAQQLDEPACPEHDPFMLLRHMVDQPADPSAAHATLKTLQAKWAADVDQLQQCLQQLQTAHQSSTAAAAAPAESCSNAAAAAAAAAGPPCLPGHPGSSWAPWQGERPDPVHAIRDVQMRMFTLTHSLAMAGKEGLFFELQLTDWYTGERIQEPCRARHRATVELLQLTPAQIQRMKAGQRFFQRLMSPLVVQRRQLHSQGVQLPYRLQPLSADLGSSPGGCSPMTGSAAHSDQGARLQEQAEQASKLRVMSKKDSLLRGAMALYMQGCLSWVQQAKLRVAMSPYHINIGIFLMVLHEYLQEQQALQQA